MTSYMGRLGCLTRFIVLLSVVLLAGGCSSLVSFATTDLADDLSQALIDNDDPVLVKAGAPAHLLMIDGMLHGDPYNAYLLETAARMYAAYASAFVEDKQRAQRLTDKALDYGLKALCVRHRQACGLRQLSFADFTWTLNTTGIKDVSTLYALGVAWASWIEVHREDWNAIAEIARAEALMQRVVDLDRFYQKGEAYLYLGIFATLFSPALGGKPEVGRAHFDRALELSHGQNFMIKVVYARQYARMMLDRELHDRLLGEVMATDPHIPGYTLANTLAQQQARQLLDSADDYF